ncbi:hypothetical protein H5410_021743 [Solanum commersonii]|uniref:Uncharacterized protein n=1 Tax=Solanum commersonii TaxID=4109 RepID=A0A9J5ZI23_SOLCO|nr:hypothetical protein H5410_021743 [Solanum commersonii]
MRLILLGISKYSSTSNSTKGAFSSSVHEGRKQIDNFWEEAILFEYQFASILSPRERLRHKSTLVQGDVQFLPYEFTFQHRKPFVISLILRRDMIFFAKSHKADAFSSSEF